MSKQTFTVPNDGEWHVLKRGAVCASIEAPSVPWLQIDIDATGLGRVRNTGPQPEKVEYA